MIDRIAGLTRTVKTWALLAVMVVVAAACGGAYNTSSTGINTQLAGVSVVDEGIRLEFAEGLSVVLRFDSMSCAGDSTASCVRSFAPAPGGPRPECVMATGQVTCTSPDGDVTASYTGSFQAHLHNATGNLVIEGSFDHAARTGSFHYAATGSCNCEASGSFNVR